VYFIAGLLLSNEKRYSLTVVFNRMTSVLHALSNMMLCLLKLMKHRIIFSLFLYSRSITCHGRSCSQEICL